MSRLSQYRVLITGILSPLAALVFYAVVYMTLTEMSSDLEKDWLFRLSMAALAMLVPFLITAFLATRIGWSARFRFQRRWGSCWPFFLWH